jgi:hypothetical protein
MKFLLTKEGLSIIKVMKSRRLDKKMECSLADIGKDRRKDVFEI